MRYVAAYLLAVLGGKTAPSQTDIEKILSSVGIECDTEKLKKVISSLQGKNFEEVIAQGREKLYKKIYKNPKIYKFKFSSVL